MAATDEARLIVSLEARVSQFERQMARAPKIANDNLKGVERAAQRTQARIEKDMAAIARDIGESYQKALASTNASFSLGDAKGLLVSKLGLIGIGLSAATAARAVSSAAADFRDMQNALRVTGLSGNALADKFADLSAIAMRQGVELAPLVDLYGKLSLSQSALGASSADLTRFTQGIALALKVGGTNSQEAAGALLQLSQALGSGTVRAEEFNSVLEGAPVIAQTVAKGLKEAGGSVSELRKLMLAGQVSSKAFFRAFLAGQAELEKQAGSALPTVQQGLNNVSTAFTVLVGQLDQTNNISGNVVSNLNAIANAIKVVGDYLNAASKGFDEFNSWLSRVGNNDVFRKIGEALGVDYSPEGIRAAGMTPAGKSDSRVADAFDVLKRDGADKTFVPPTGSAKSAASVPVQNGAVPVSVKDYPVDNSAKQFGAPIDTARQFAGLKEATNSAALQALFRQGAGIQLDPQTTAWCAAFASAAIGLAGGKAPKFTAAKDFLQYGTETDKPQVGDLVVLSRGKQGSHVGFYEGDNGDGSIRVFGGNQSNSVKSSNFSKSDVLGYRQIPGAAPGGSTAVEDLLAQAKAQSDLSEAVDKAFASSQQQIQQLQAQTATYGQSTYQIAKAAEQQRLLNELTQQGVAITPQLTAQIQQQAEAYGQAAAGAEAAGEAFQQSQQLQQFVGQNLSGFFSAIISGSGSAEDALRNLVASLADAAMQALLLGQGPLGGLFGMTGQNGQAGGLIGSLFSAFSGGGVPTGFAGGGWTGPGGKYQPAGIVHGGEFVFDKAATSRIGVGNLERLRQGLAGYAAGGAVGFQVPGVPTIPDPGAVVRAPSSSITYSPQIDARGADAEALARLEAALARDKRDFGNNVMRVVRRQRSERRL